MQYRQLLCIYVNRREVASFISINTTIHSTVRHFLSIYDTSIAGSSLIACQKSTASLGMCELGYLQVSSRIPKRNFHGSAQNNGVEQHSEWSRKPSRKPSRQQRVLKKAGGCMCCCCIVSDRPSNSFHCFLLVTLPHMNDMISISIHKELQSCQHLSSSLVFT